MNPSAEELAAMIADAAKELMPEKPVKTTTQNQSTVQTKIDPKELSDYYFRLIKILEEGIQLAPSSKLVNYFDSMRLHIQTKWSEVQEKIDYLDRL